MKQKMVCKIVVNPEKSLFVDEVQIRGYGFGSNAKITIQCQYLSDEEHMYFQSFAHVFCNDKGAFDLTQMSVVGGTYTGIEPMGLFWSMVLIGKSFNLLRRIDIKKPIIYNFKVFNGFCSDFDGFQPLCECCIEKENMANNIERVPVVNGNIRGTIFKPKNEGIFPGVMLIYGGVQKHHIYEETAAHFANNGFAAFILAYFGVDGLPRRYDRSPIRMEYFEEALNYFIAQSYVLNQGIGVFGQSKGAEIAVAMSCLFPKVLAVALNPAIVFADIMSVTYGGRPLVQFTPNEKRRIDNLVFQTPDTIFSYGYTPDPIPNECIYPFYLSSADVFIIFAGDDHLSNTQSFTDTAVTKMKEFGKKNYEVVYYRGLGHLLYLPNTPVTTLAGSPTLPRGVNWVYGGNIKYMHHAAEKDVWPKLIHIFRSSLSSNRKQKAKY